MQKISNHHNSCVGVKKVERWMKQKETIKNLSNMKATKFISACAVLAALASCSNELSQPTAEDTPIRIQANVGGITTRAGSSIQGNKFDIGESVNVYIYENTTSDPAPYTYGTNGLLTCTADGDGNLSFSDPQYFPANGHGIDVYGIYPTSVKEKNSTQDFSVDTDQSDATNYKASDLMYASCVSNHTKGTPVSLKFKHKLSKVTVELAADTGFDNSDLNNAVVKITNTSTKCSIASLNKSGIDYITASTTSSDIQPIKIGTWNSDSKDKMSAIVIPQNVSAGSQLFEVTLNGISTPYKYKIPAGGSGVTFSEGKEYKYKFTVKKDGIDVNSTITDWGDGGTTNGDATLD